jgi:hypothetical protein
MKEYIIIILVCLLNGFVGFVLTDNLLVGLIESLCLSIIGVILFKYLNGK